MTYAEALVPVALKRFRKEFKVTQKQAAQTVGVTERAYQDYEAGKTKISAVAVVELANTFNVSADYLLGRTNAPDSAAAQIAADEAVSEAEAELVALRQELHAEVDRLIEQRFSGFLPALRALKAAGFTLNPSGE